MIKAISYQRCSSNSKTQQNSISNQLSSIRSFASSNRYTVIKEYIEVASASKSGVLRTELDECIETLSNNPEIFLIMRDATRLTRDISDYSKIKPFLSRIRFVNYGNRPLSELEMSLFIIIGQNESKVLGDRISDGIKSSKRRAKENGVVWVWNNPTNAVREQGLAIRMGNADTYAQKIVDINQMLIESGYSSMKERLNRMIALGYKSSRGKQLRITNIYSTLRRASNRGIGPTRKDQANGY